MASPLPRRADPSIATAEAPVQRAEPGAPAASGDAIRLALHLRNTPSAGGGRILIFVPVSARADVAPLVDDVVRGLVELSEVPVLVMDLRASAARRPGRWVGVSQDEEDAMSAAWGSALHDVARVQPLAGRGNAMLRAASPEFSGLFTHARTRYAFVLCIADAVSVSVDTLIASGQCDGVVLTVSPGQTTRSEVQRVAGELRRAHANVIGFVVDARVAEKGA